MKDTKDREIVHEEHEGHEEKLLKVFKNLL